MFAGGGGDLWSLKTVGGVLVLGLVLAYATIKNRKGTTPEKRRLQDRATEDVYAAEQRDPANR